MDKNNQIDDLFRSKLGNYQPEYVPEHWQMMKAAIKSSPKAIPVSSFNFTANLLIVLSGIIILGAGIYTYLLTQKYNSIESRDKIIAQIISGKNTTSQLNDLKRDVTESVNSSSMITNIASTSIDNIIKENDNVDNTIFNKGNSKRNPIHRKNTTLSNSSEKVLKPLADNNKKVEKTLINNAEIATLSNNFNTDGNLIVENIVAIGGPVVEINNILQENTEATINNEKITNKKDAIDSEIVPNMDNEYNSVIDDYLGQKQKHDKKHKKAIEHKISRSLISESQPDCKVSMVNNFVVNPAYAGFNQRHTISLSTLVHKPLYKPSNDFNIPFEYSIAYDFNFGKRKNCGIGIDYKRFLGAAEGSLGVDLTFAYRINLAKYHNLRLGASASYIASNINKSNLTFPDMIDSRDGFVYNTKEVFLHKTAKNNFDLGMGIWYSWKTLYLGVSAIHLTSPEIGVVSKSRIPREYMLSAGYGFNMSKSFNVLSALELKYNERIMNVSPNMLFTYKRWLLFGLEFQNLRNAGLVLGFNVKNNIIINIHGGVPMNSDIIKNFGVVDYAAFSLRFQFGNYR